MPPNVIRVAPEQSGLQAGCANQVERHQHEFLADRPWVVLGDGGSQFCNPTRRGVLLQKQIQHGHEMAFAASETAEQITSLARFSFERVTHQRKRLIETFGELRGNDVIPQRLFWTFQSLGQSQNEIPAAHFIPQVKKVFDVSK